jgi:hypothetical protein
VLALGDDNRCKYQVLSHLLLLPAVRCLTLLHGAVELVVVRRVKPFVETLYAYDPSVTVVDFFACPEAAFDAQLEETSFTGQVNQLDSCYHRVGMADSFSSMWRRPQLRRTNWVCTSDMCLPRSPYVFLCDDPVQHELHTPDRTDGDVTTCFEEGAMLQYVQMIQNASELRIGQPLALALALTCDLSHVKTKVVLLRDAMRPWVHLKATADWILGHPSGLPT